MSAVWWRVAPLPAPRRQDLLDRHVYAPELLAIAVGVLLEGRTWRSWRLVR